MSEKLHLTEDSLARWFADRHGHELQYVADKRWWLILRDGRWRRDEIREVHALARTLCRDAVEQHKPTDPVNILSAHTVNAVVDMARSDLAIDYEQAQQLQKARP